jgi:hypothetical protein
MPTWTRSRIARWINRTFKANFMEKQDRKQVEEKPENGVVTVNNDRNPTPEERDERIGLEPDTARERSERESVTEKKKG